MDDEPEEPSAPSPAPHSKTPSWVMLGFVLGALAMLALPRPEKIAPPPPALAALSVAAPLPPQITVERGVFFEDVFAELSPSAVWQDDLTEVAFWNPDRRAYADCYEVLRVNDKFYFRSIPHLTRPLLTKGVGANSPLQFTVPGDGAFQRPGPTFDQINRGQFPRASEPTRSLPAPVPELPLARPPVELPRPDGK